PEAHFRRGIAFHQLKQEREAIADFDRALMLRPGHIESHHLRAHAFERLQQWDRADADFSAALDRRSGDAHLLDRRGRCRLNLNRFDEGLADLERSLAAKPEQPELKRFLALTCNNRAWKMLTGPDPGRDAAAALNIAEKAVKYEPERRFFVN